MKASTKQYAQVLLDLVEDKKKENLEEIIKKFVKVLIEHNQESKIDHIIDDFEVLWNKKNKIVKAEITSVNDLDEKVNDLLKKYIQDVSRANEIEVSNKKDKNILGGVIIKYADNIFDASLKTKVKTLKEKIKS